MTGGWGHWVAGTTEFGVRNICTAQHMVCSAPPVCREAWLTSWTGKGLQDSEVQAGEG